MEITKTRPNRKAAAVLGICGLLMCFLFIRTGKVSTVIQGAGILLMCAWTYFFSMQKWGTLLVQYKERPSSALVPEALRLGAIGLFIASIFVD